MMISRTLITLGAILFWSIAGTLSASTITPEHHPDALLAASPASVSGLTAMLPWLLVGLSGVLCFLLLKQNGRILLRLDALEMVVAQAQAQSKKPDRSELPLGPEAPDFDLPELEGNGRKRLADFKGQKILLAFFNPGCGYCATSKGNRSEERYDLSAEGKALA